ncbi:hypothetical protein [Mesorhizobium carmichaelinearum]|uniref:hypothetical protein n=1 Tax=Mesorhizobium carmichaelinearum TaxID=1208188 RepID=UPI003F6E3071
MIVEIRSFQTLVDGGDHAEVELFVRILNDRNGEVLASTCFTASPPARAAAITPMSARLFRPPIVGSVER